MADEVNPDNLEIADELIAERRSALPGHLPADMNPFSRNVITVIDTISLWVGKIVAWLLIPLCLAMVYEVIVRKYGTSPGLWFQELVRVFTDPESETLLSPAPTLWAYDISRMLYGAMFMLAAGYALSVGVHIRADFIYRNWSDRTQAIMDIVLYTVLFFPGMLLMFRYSFEFAFDTWTRGERGMDTAWMPLMGPIKSCIPIGVGLLIMQGISEWLKCAYAVVKGRWPV